MAYKYKAPSIQVIELEESSEILAASDPPIGTLPSAMEPEDFEDE